MEQNLTLQKVEQLMKTNLMLFDALNTHLILLLKAEQNAIAFDLITKMVEVVNDDKFMPEDIKKDMLEEYNKLGTLITYKIIIDNGELEKKG